MDWLAANSQFAKLLRTAALSDFRGALRTRTRICGKPSRLLRLVQLPPLTVRLPGRTRTVHSLFWHLPLLQEDQVSTRHLAAHLHPQHLEGQVVEDLRKVEALLAEVVGEVVSPPPPPLHPPLAQRLKVSAVVAVAEEDQQPEVKEHSKHRDSDPLLLEVWGEVGFLLPRQHPRQHPQLPFKSVNGGLLSTQVVVNTTTTTKSRERPLGTDLPTSWVDCTFLFERVERCGFNTTIWVVRVDISDEQSLRAVPIRNVRLDFLVPWLGCSRKPIVSHD